jgi:hypothetical protein
MWRTQNWASDVASSVSGRSDWPPDAGFGSRYPWPHPRDASSPRALPIVPSAQPKPLIDAGTCAHRSTVIAWGRIRGGGRRYVPQAVRRLTRSRHVWPMPKPSSQADPHMVISHYGPDRPELIRSRFG